VEHLANVVKKELLELMRDQKFIAGLIISVLMFPLMGTIVGGSIGASTAEKSVIGVVDCDGGEYARLFQEYLSESAEIVRLRSLEEATEDLNAVIVIPEGFSKNISSYLKADVEVYVILASSSISATIKSSKATGAIMGAQGRLSEYVVENAGLNPDFTLKPVRIKEYTIFEGKVAYVPPEVVSNLVFSQVAMLPMVIFMLVMFTAQLAITSMALEKENKTLELLLSQPVNRMTILVGKLIASLILSLISAFAFFIGFSFYMSQTVPSSTENIVKNININELLSLGVFPTPVSSALLLINVLLGLLAVMSLSVVIGAATEDVRSAQSLMGLVFPLILIPALTLMFTDLETMPLPLALVVIADPFSHPMIAVKAAFTNNYSQLLLSAAYLIVFSLVSLYVASKLFASERILTLRFRWSRRRRVLSLF